MTPTPERSDAGAKFKDGALTLPTLAVDSAPAGARRGLLGLAAMAHKATAAAGLFAGVRIGIGAAAFH